MSGANILHQFRRLGRIYEIHPAATYYKKTASTFVGAVFVNIG